MGSTPTIERMRKRMRQYQWRIHNTGNASIQEKVRQESVEGAISRHEKKGKMQFHEGRMANGTIPYDTTLNL